MKTSSVLKRNSQKLRREMTKEERRLWYDFLKNLPCTVQRQKVIGTYIVDFYIHSAKTVIEVDGTQHYLPDGMESDVVRDRFMRDQGLTVLRYSNAEVNQSFEAVCEDILNHLHESLPMKAAPAT